MGTFLLARWQEGGSGPPPFPPTPYYRCSHSNGAVASRCHGSWVPGCCRDTPTPQQHTGRGDPQPCVRAAGTHNPIPSTPPSSPHHPRRYAGALAEAVDVAKLLGSRSLRELEEALFCGTTGWETYWERNEPLRDADEVAVPVLCVCSADDPVRGPPARTLPRELFRSSPYFFLLLTPRGGHCGFPQRGPGRCWAHEAVLEYFRAIGEFLRAEERRTGVPQPRRWGGPVPEPPAFTWQRSYTR